MVRSRGAARESKRPHIRSSTATYTSAFRVNVTPQLLTAHTTTSPNARPLDGETAVTTTSKRGTAAENQLIRRHTYPLLLTLLVLPTAERSGRGTHTQSIPRDRAAVYAFTSRFDGRTQAMSQVRQPSTKHNSHSSRHTEWVSSTQTLHAQGQLGRGRGDHRTAQQGAGEEGRLGEPRVVGARTMSNWSLHIVCLRSPKRTEHINDAWCWAWHGWCWTLVTKQSGTRTSHKQVTRCTTGSATGSATPSTHTLGVRRIRSVRCLPASSTRHQDWVATLAPTQITTAWRTSRDGHTHGSRRQAKARQSETLAHDYHDAANYTAQPAFRTPTRRPPSVVVGMGAASTRLQFQRYYHHVLPWRPLRVAPIVTVAKARVVKVCCFVGVSLLCPHRMLCPSALTSGDEDAALTLLRDCPEIAEELDPNFPSTVAEVWLGTRPSVCCACPSCTAPSCPNTHGRVLIYT